MKINNKFIISIVIIGMIVLITALVVFIFEDRSLNQTPPNPINKRGDNQLYASNKFTITQYITGEYNINIILSPFEQIKTEAEQKFLELLNITQAQACSYNVIITTPHYANPEEAGKTYYLSFCPNLPQPSIAINPAIANLELLSVNPSPGVVEMGETKNGIALTFNKPIDLTTTSITISPSIEFRETHHPRDKTILTINPTQEWQSNAGYTITIKSGAYALDRSAQLKENVVLIYQVRKVNIPDDHGEFVTP